jgi:uncharacterized phage protein (TIGR02220 family)
MTQKKETYYLAVPAAVAHKVPPLAALLYGEIAGLSRGRFCTATNKYFAGCYHVSDKTVQRQVACLVQQGFVSATYENSGTLRMLKALEVPRDSEDLTVDTCGSRLGQACSDTPVSDVQQNNTLNKEKNSPCTTRENEAVETVVATLNREASTRFSPAEGKTAALIAARLREGFTAAQLQQVIRCKCAEWNHSPAPGEKDMRPFLRPETLFGAKCESYLKAAQSRPEPGKVHYRTVTDADVPASCLQAESEVRPRWAQNI